MRAERERELLRYVFGESSYLVDVPHVILPTKVTVLQMFWRTSTAQKVCWGRSLNCCRSWSGSTLRYGTRFLWRCSARRIVWSWRRSTRR